MKILIISYYFAPQNVIGAVRATKLAKYLTRMGHEVTVLCGEGVTQLKDPTLARDLEELTNVHVVREWNPIRERKKRIAAIGQTESPAGKSEQGQSQAVRHSVLRELAARVMNALYLLILYFADRDFTRQCMKEVKRMGRTFDVVLSSYGPFSSHLIGRKVKKRGAAQYWIADFRDVAEPPLPWKKAWAQNQVRRARVFADRVTGVSQGYLETMGLTGTAIPNGFDPEDLPGIEEEPGKGKERLRFVYCGQMYGEQRDLRPFFRTIKELMDEGDVQKESLSLEHAGKRQDLAAFRNQAAAFGLEDAVKGHGLIPRSQAIRLQRSADAVLIAAWNTPECLGNLPGKLLEVLMMDKPVICCTVGCIPGSESAKVIRQTQAGYCYEEAEGDASYQGLKAYVKRLCDSYGHGSAFPFAPCREEIEKYAYTGVAKAFEALMEGLE